MARGAVAKATVENRIREAFGADFVGSNGKELFVWADDGNERVQIKIAMTCPKTNYEGGDVMAAATFNTAASASTDWTSQTVAPVELTEDEKQTVNSLLERLGL